MPTLSSLSVENGSSATGRGFRGPRRDVEDYPVNLLYLRTGIVAFNSTLLHCDDRGRPYGIDDFHEELGGLGLLLHV